LIKKEKKRPLHKIGCIIATFSYFQQQILRYFFPTILNYSYYSFKTVGIIFAFTLEKDVFKQPQPLTKGKI